MSFTSILTYGFAIFAMFFGSGNLVFPLQIGFSAGSQWISGFIGLLMTGILLPFLGLFVIKLHKGNYQSFFSQAGGIAAKVLPLFTLSLLGSFGVVPRCITVAHGGLEHIYPGLSLVLFSLLFSVTTFFFCLKDQTMITILGKWMSPILVASLFILIIIGIVKAPTAGEISSMPSAFSDGFIIGYQTMDLFAAYFFSALIFTQIQEQLPPESCHKTVLRVAIIPSIIGSIMLAVIYLGFVFLGSHYRELIINTEPELMLPTIVWSVMGSSATALISIAMLFSCLTTAVALNNIYARYLCNTINKKSVTFPFVLFFTTAISFVLSLLDFRGIAAFLKPALDISYPGLIALTITSIIWPDARKAKSYLFWVITFFMMAYWFASYLGIW